MKSRSGVMTLGAIAALLVLSGPVGTATAASAGPLAVAGSTAAADLPPPIRPMNDDEKAGAGCVISAVAAMGIVTVIGPTEFIMTVVGGLLVPSSTPVLLVGLVSTIASMTCGLGATLTPAVLWGWRQVGSPGGPHGAAAADPGPHGSVGHDAVHSRAVASFGSGGMMVTEAPQAAQ